MKYMNTEDLIQLSGIFVDASDDDSELVEALEKQSYSQAVAERYVAFMPIAFGRVVLNQIGSINFSSLYKTSEGSKEFSLNEEPIFKLAFDLATQSYEQGILDREVFSAIASRSAEFNAANKALNDGADINGATFAPVLLFGYKTLDKKKGFFRGLFS
jgi:parvulin-like peptidyl-prolyl isomerase